MLLAAEKLERRKTDAILTMNDEDLRIATKNSLALGQIIPIFGMGVPYPVFKCEFGELRKKYADSDDFVILCVAELSERKNQEFIINAMPKILSKIPNAKLWLVGDGAEKVNLEKRAIDLEIYDRVSFIGQQNNPLDFMRECDLYVSASKSEGLPFNIVEALSCGKTVLASRVKGHSDILESGAGILYELNNKWEFTDKVIDIFEGQISIKSDDIYEGYRNFSDAMVFTDTYDKLKEAGWL